MERSFYNRVSELGYSDILIEIPKGRTGVVVEMKYAEDGDLERACTEALQQIEEKQYDAELIGLGFEKEEIHHYGFAFKGKEVLIGE